MRGGACLLSGSVLDVVMVVLCYYYYLMVPLLLLSFFLWSQVEISFRSFAFPDWELSFFYFRPPWDRDNFIAGFLRCCLENNFPSMVGGMGLHVLYLYILE